MEEIIEEVVVAIKPENEDPVEFPLPPVEVIACALDIDIPSSASKEVNRFCRLCLRDSTSLFPLMSRVQGVLVPDMIETVTGIRIDMQDSFPKKLCIHCLTKLDYAYHIQMEFIQSDLVLKNLAQSKTKSLVENLVEYQDGLLVSTETYAEKLLRLNSDIIRLRLIRKEQELTGLNGGQIIEIDVEDKVEESLTVPEDELTQNTELVTEEEEIPKKKMRRYNLDVREEKLDPNRCYICEEDLANEKDLSAHLSKHVDMIPYKCVSCTAIEGKPQIMVSLIMLHRHFRMHASSIKCPQCSFKTCTAGGLYSHMARRHSNTTEYSCDLCGAKITTKSTYDRHMRMHKAMEEGRYACKFCDKRFATKARVTRHERGHTNERPFKCRYCPKAFTNGTSFLAHERTHTGEKGYRCDVCGKSFRTKTNLNGHVDAVHQLPGQPKKIRDPKYAYTPEPVKCDQEGCNFETNNRTKLSAHKANHAMKYHCEHCEERFATKQRLDQHRYVHTGHKPYFCEICGKNFRFRKSFVEHMAGHRNDRPHSCDVCGSSFVRERTLKEHMLKHSDKLSYGCRYCDKKFKYRADQSKHEKSHTGALPSDEGLDDELQKNGTIIKEGVVK